MKKKKKNEATPFDDVGVPTVEWCGIWYTTAMATCAAPIQAITLILALAHDQNFIRMSTNGRLEHDDAE